jgi:MFS family permease
VTLPPGRADRPRRRGARRLVAPWPLLVAGFASMAAFVGMETTVAYLASARFGAGPAFVGLLLCAAGLTLTVVQGFLVSPAAHRFGEARVATAGAALMAAGLLALPFLTTVPFVAAVLVVAAGNGLVTVAAASLLAAAGPPEELGARMGQGQSAASVARAAGPLSAGALFDLTLLAPYLLGAALSTGVACLLAVANRQGRGRRSVPAGRTEGSG